MIKRNIGLLFVWKYVFLLHILNKDENILNARYFLKIAKINSQQEKTVCPNRKT